MSNKIQIKRGNIANIPILDSGEFGFTIDTEEVYIGTGSSNIRILTSDDIYTDSNVESYLSGGTGINFSEGVISTNDSEINHNSLNNYSVDQHRVIVDTSNNSTDLFSAQKITNDHKKFSGFENRTDSSIAMNGNDFEITTTSYNVYFCGIGKKTVTSTLSIEITEDQNITYIYLDWSGSAVRINKSITPWDIKDGTNIPLAIIFKDGSTYAITDERHGYNRNLEWHNWAHNNIGAVYYNGLSGTFTDTTLSITQGIIYDEDIRFDTGGTKTTCSIWYRNSSSRMRLIRNSTTPYYLDGDLKYDNGSGTLQDVGANNYVVSWIYASNDSSEPIYTILGQNNHSNLNSARNESTPIINLSTAEWKLLYKVIYRNTATPTYIESQDFRTVQTGVPIQNISPVSHTILTDRDASNQHPASSILYDETTTVTEELDNKVDTDDFRLIGITWSYENSNKTISSFEGVMADTVSGSFTITLPSSPSTGDIVGFTDLNSSWGDNSLIIDGNGNTLFGDNTFEADVNNMTIYFIYSETDTNWTFANDATVFKSRVITEGYIVTEINGGVLS